MNKYRECGLALHRRELRQGHLFLDIGLLAGSLGYDPVGRGHGTTVRPFKGSSGYLGCVCLLREGWHRYDVPVTGSRVCASANANRRLSAVHALILSFISQGQHPEHFYCVVFICTIILSCYEKLYSVLYVF
jgi:hypothetical protein